MKRRDVPPIWLWVVVAVAGVTVAVLHGTDVTADHAAANVITLIVGFVALIALVGWFSFFSGHSRGVRLVPLLGAGAVIAVLAVMLRIDRVSGELVPRFALRFSPKRDELLEKPAPEVSPENGTSTVDLRTTTAHDFPEFLGPGRKLRLDHIALADDWDAQTAKPLWRREIGAGWSAFAVVGGYAVTMEQRGFSEMVTCYEVNSGRLRWVHSVAGRYESILAGVGPRATPTIDEGMVYTLGARGRLSCLFGATGGVKWEKDLWEEFGESEEDEAEQVPYGRANSPLVLGDLVVVPAGGPLGGPWVSLVAFDKQTGNRVWEGGNRLLSYSSPVAATLAGVEQILIVDEDYVSGHDVHSGGVLWEHEWPGSSSSNANVSQAVAVPPFWVFLSKGYGQGAALIRLLRQGDGTITAKPVWQNSKVMRTKFTNVAVLDAYVYGLSDGILECIELKTGRRMWKAGRYGHGQILLVSDRLLVLAESGELLLIEATPKRPNHVLGRFQALDGLTWNNLALSGPYLLVRNAQQAACYKLPLKKTALELKASSSISGRRRP